MLKEALVVTVAVTLLTALLPITLTTGPTQPPVDTTTLYVGRAGWGPKYADSARAYDSRSCELIFNAYDRLIELGEDVTNQWGTWDVEEQYWEFSPGLAENVPTRQEIVMTIPDTGINPSDPVCYWFEPIPPDGKWYHIEGWVDNNPDGELGFCDVLYIGEYPAMGLPIQEAITVRTWHVLEYIPGVSVTVHHYYYDFIIRVDPAINFVDETGNIVDIFDIFDAEYSFERGLIQDQYGSPMWMFYKPLFDQMNSDWWDTGNPENALCLSYLIGDAIEIVSLDPSVLRINLGIPFPDGLVNKAFLQIICGTWASIVSKEFSVGIGCWDGDLFSDVNSNGYPDWWDNWRHIHLSPYDNPTKRYVGTGPYRVTLFDEINRIVLLERNVFYWKGWPAPERKAFLETIDIEYIADWQLRREAFKACQLDICEVPRSKMLELLDPNDPARMQTGWGDPFIEHPEVKTIKNIAPNLMLDAIFFTFIIDPTSLGIFEGRFPNGIPTDFFNNTHVRQAFAYAFNHSRYLKEVWLDEATCRETPDIWGLVPDYYCHSPDPPWTYDADMTKVIENLQAAMFTQDGETKSVWGWSGFHLIMYYNIGNEERKIACEFLKAMFDEMNILYGKSFVVDIVGLDWPTFLNDRENFTLPIFTDGWQANFADPDNLKRSFMHSQGCFAFFQGYTAENGWCATFGPQTSLTKDVLLDLGVKTPDGPEREEIYKDLDDIYLADCPSLPIAQPIGRRWCKYWVKGWHYNAMYGGSTTAFLETCDYYYKLYKEDTCWADVIGRMPPFPPFPDGHCNMRDIGYIAGHFGAKAPNPPIYDPKWAPGTYGCFGCDVYGDRKVDMRDIGFACAHFCHTAEP